MSDERKMVQFTPEEFDVYLDSVARDAADQANWVGVETAALALETFASGIESAYAVKTAVATESLSEEERRGAAVMLGVVVTAARRTARKIRESGSSPVTES